MALPFLFIPINAVAYVGLPQRKTAQASSLLNVFRNLGGTVGISFSQVMLANGLQRHQAVLVEQLNPLNPNYQDWIRTAGPLFGGGGQVAAMADPTTLAVLYQQVQRQAAMLSFLDVFHALMIVVLIVSPVALLMRPPKRGRGGGGMAH